MTLSEFKAVLKLRAMQDEEQPVLFLKPMGRPIPVRTHLTEVGIVNRMTYDCGGDARDGFKILLQLWTPPPSVTIDVDPHFLTYGKVLSIVESTISLLYTADTSIEKGMLGGIEIDVEYQGDTTIETYGIDFDEKHLLLTPRYTDCLAKDACGIAETTTRVETMISDLPKKKCSPSKGKGCC